MMLHLPMIALDGFVAVGETGQLAERRALPETITQQHGRPGGVSDRLRLPPPVARRLEPAIDTYLESSAPKVGNA